VVSLGIFSVIPPTEPCAPRSTQPLKVSTRDFSWGKGGRCVWVTTYHPCSAETSRISGALTYPEPLGPPRPVAGDIYLLLIAPPSSSSCDNVEGQFVVVHFVKYAACQGNDKLLSVNYKHKSNVSETCYASIIREL